MILFCCFQLDRVCDAGQRVYSFDRCFNPSSNNAFVYDIVGKPIVLKTMEGYNGTVFSYGQTGSGKITLIFNCHCEGLHYRYVIVCLTGKTWTMRGSDGDPGMMILCIRDIFEWIETHPQQKYVLKVSYMEVYNEEINDLLGDGVTSKNLRIVSEDAIRGAVIEKLIEEEVSNSDGFMEVLSKGEAARQYAATHMNAESSRSHTIYRVVVEAHDVVEEPVEQDIYASSWSRMNSQQANSRISYLNLVDLAGSERQKQTNATGKTLKEGANINKSLLALGACISKLGEASKKGGAPKPGGKPVFIPFRDSKLTRILKQSLAGNTMTSVLCAVTPAAMHREETVSTLKFGQLCKTIKNSIKNVEVLDDQRLIKQYRQQIQELRVQLEEMQASETPVTHRLRDLETYIVMNNLPLPAPTQVDPANPDSPSSPGSSSQNFFSSSNTGEAGELHLQEGGLDRRHMPPSPGHPYAMSRRNSGTGLKLLQDENQRMNEKINDLQKQLIYYERKFEEFRDFEEAKAAFDDYESNIRNDLDEERAKLEIEIQNIKEEKYKMLSERTSLEEKESRLGLLITDLDERDSRLRQLLDNTREQRLNFDIAVLEVKRREDLIQEQQKNLNVRDQQLQERLQHVDQRFEELHHKEKSLGELDQRLNQQGKELTDREQRIQLMFSRVANTEKEYQVKNDILSTQESILKKKEYELAVKEQELLSKHDELLSFESMLHDKESKLSNQQKEIDQHEEKLQSISNKLSKREEVYEDKVLDLHRLEQRLQDLQNNYQLQYQELNQREESFQLQIKSFASDRQVYQAQVQDLQQRESALHDKALLYQSVLDREQDLQRRIQEHQERENDFYHVKVIEITSRHKREVDALDLLLKQQASIMNNYQADINKLKEEIKRLKEELSSSQESSRLKEVQLQELREHPEELPKLSSMLSPGRNDASAPSSPDMRVHAGHSVDQLMDDVLSNWDDCVKKYSDPANQAKFLDDSSSDDDEDEEVDEHDKNDADGEQPSFDMSQISSRMKSLLRAKAKDVRSKHNTHSYLTKLSELQSYVEQILEEANRPPPPGYDRRYVNKHTANVSIKERRGSLGSAIEKRSMISSIHTNRIPMSDSSSRISADEMKQSSANASGAAEFEVKNKEPAFYRGHSLTSIFSDMPSPTPPPPVPAEASPSPQPLESIPIPESEPASSVSPQQMHPKTRAPYPMKSPEKEKSKEKPKAEIITPPKTTDGVQYIRSYSNQNTGSGGKDITGLVEDRGYRGGVPVTTVTLSSTTRRIIEEGYATTHPGGPRTPPRRSRGFAHPKTPN
jgi:hypothetical protein